MPVTSSTTIVHRDHLVLLYTIFYIKTLSGQRYSISVCQIRGQIVSSELQLQVVGVFFRVPHTLLISSTGVCCSWIDLVLSLDLADSALPPPSSWLVAGQQQHALSSSGDTAGALPIGFATVQLTMSSLPVSRPQSM